LFDWRQMFEEQVCKDIYDSIIGIRKNWELGSEVPTNALYGFTLVDSAVVCEKISDHSDIFDLLYKARENKIVNKWPNIALYSEGLVNPNDLEAKTKPLSKHSKSQKAKVVCIVGRKYMKVQTLMVFGDEWLYDPVGYGPLADSLLSLYPKRKEKQCKTL